MHLIADVPVLVATFFTETNKKQAIPSTFLTRHILIHSNYIKISTNQLCFIKKKTNFMWRSLHFLYTCKLWRTYTQILRARAEHYVLFFEINFFHTENFALFDFQIEVKKFFIAYFCSPNRHKDLFIFTFSLLSYAFYPSPTHATACKITMSVATISCIGTLEMRGFQPPRLCN